MTRQGDGVSERLTRAGITDREAEVLWAVTEWQRNQEIADRLHVSIRTVETHVGQIFLKLGLREEGAEHRRVAAVLAFLRAYPEG